HWHRRSSGYQLYAQLTQAQWAVKGHASPRRGDEAEEPVAGEGTPVEVASALGILAVLALVAANGFFVAAEFALVKVRATRIEQLVRAGSGAARVVQRQIAHLDNYIAATQLGITLASLALGWIGEPALAHLVAPVFVLIAGSGSPAAEELAQGTAVALSFLVITAFHIVLGELVPKSVALQRSERIALLVGPPLLIFDRIFRPFIALLNGVGNAVVRL